MANVVKWDEFGKNQKEKAQRSGKRDLNFIPMGKRGVGKTYRIRPIGDMVQFWEYMVQHDGRWRSAITANPDECPIALKHSEKPKETYAVNVIDRADGQVKILKGPVSVFQEFYTFWKHQGKKPGGAEGGDYELKVTGKKGRDYYQMEFLEKAPLSEEERAMALENMYELEKIFKATPAEDIEEKLYPSEEGETVSVGVAKEESDTSNNEVDSSGGDEEDIPF